jgi:hypothetical protein
MEASAVAITETVAQLGLIPHDSTVPAWVF